MDATNPNHVVKHYGSVAKAAEAQKVSRRAVYKWLDEGEVPENRAYRIEVDTEGALQVPKKSRRSS